MKSPTFAYVRPESLAGALDLLHTAGPDARVLAGGQSLLPMLHMRLVRPETIIDINQIADLAGIELDDATLKIGAMTRYAVLEDDPLVARHAPLLATAVRLIGDRQIRNRGTIGGSLAQADPLGEMALVCLALDASIGIRSAAGERVLPVDELLLGAYTTDLEDEELLVDVRIPLRPRRGLVHEVTRRHNDFAVVALAVIGEQTASGTWTELRIAIAGLDDRALLATEAAASLTGGELDDAAIAAAAASCAALGDPASDIRASDEYRRHLIGVHVARVLRRLRSGEGVANA